MGQFMSSSFCLLVTVVSAGVLPFACSKEVPTPEPAPSVAAEAVVSQEPAQAEPSSGTAPEPAPSAVASAEASAAAAAGSATSGSGAKAPPAGKAPASPTPPPPAGYTGPDPCRATTFKFASVRNACNQGGVKQAKSLMKGMVKRAKENGKEDMKCSSCHDNTKTYTLKDNAVADMRALQ
jgi:hypothetical protein